MVPGQLHPADRSTMVARNVLRGSLVIGFLAALVTWVFGFGSQSRFLVMVLAWLAWAVWGGVGVMVKFAAWLAASRCRVLRPVARPGWGTLLWVCAPLCFVVCHQVSLDARIWLAMHHEELVRLARVPDHEPTGSWQEEGGYRVLRPDGPLLIVHAANFFVDSRGVAFDPDRTLAVGARAEGILAVSRLVELSDGWWAWYASD